MPKLSTYVIVAFLALYAHTTQISAQPRTVHENILISTREPAVEIALPPDVTYVGTDKWVLYDVADCEVYVFVEADEHQKVHRAYWIQFEKYIPSKPAFTYEYSDPITRLNGFDVFVKANFGRDNGEAPRDGSDLEYVQRLIRDKGFVMPEETMNVRFVHLLDESKRSELMIIYIEDMTPAGVTFDQLIQNEEISPRWNPIASELIKRAKEQISIRSIQAQ